MELVKKEMRNKDERLNVDNAPQKFYKRLAMV